MSESSEHRAPPERRALRAVLQLAGFGAGLLLLVWCVRIALRPENREQLERLAEARWWETGAMLGLSALTLCLNGLLFWLALTPVRRLRIVDVVAVNFIAHLMSFLPFKLGLFFRVLFHNRRDHVKVLTIGAWFTAAGLFILPAVVPVLAASVWRPSIDVWWWAAVIAGSAVLVVATLVSGRLFAAGGGWSWIEGIAHRVAVTPLGKLTRGRVLPRAHEGLVILSSPSAAIGSLLLRHADLCVHVARFVVAAHIVGAGLTVEQAVLAGIAYFLVGLFVPTGLLGLREVGVFAVLGSAEFAVVVLMITAAEAATAIFGAAAAALWLRPDRLLRRGVKALVTPEELGDEEAAPRRRRRRRRRRWRRGGKADAG